MILIELPAERGLRDLIQVPRFVDGQAEIPLQVRITTPISQKLCAGRKTAPFPLSLFQCSLFIFRHKHLLGTEATVSRYEKNCGGKDTSHLHTAVNFSEYFHSPHAP